MQIHEIARRKINEGPLKNVASAPVNFGKTTVAMPQQSVAPSKVSFAPNMMPKPAPAPSTNLAVAPQTTALAKTPGTGVATTPAGGALTTAPRTAQLAPAANRVRPSQSDPNVIDVDAKDITNRQSLAAPSATQPTVAAPARFAATQPTVDAPVAQPVAQPAAQPAPAVKPVGLTPADMAKLRAQDKSKAPAPTTAAPEKAGFMRNAAEYFANKTMDKAGIPLSQQGRYHPGGHMAALQGTGTTAIAQAEQKIAYNLAQEYVNQGTLNRNKTQLTPAAIQSAASLINQAGNDLQLNFDNITKLTQHYAQEIAKYKKAQKEKQAQGQIDIEQLKDQLKVAEKAKRFKQVQQLSDELKRRGLSDEDIGTLRANAVTDVKNNFKNNLKQMTPNQPPATPPISTDQMRGNKPGAPTTQDYANLEKRLQQAMAAQGQTQ